MTHRICFVALQPESHAWRCQLEAQWCERFGRSPALHGHVLLADRCDAALIDRIHEHLIATPHLERARVVVLTRASDAEFQLALLRLKVGDVIENDDPLTALHARLTRWARVDAAIDEPRVKDHLIGNGTAWRAALRQVVEAAVYSEAPLLLTGPTGTGKELLARLLHTFDARPRKRELIIVDCTTLAPELGGSELFGHERGAFTGAVGEREGAVALADGGTLFLDEVGELPLEFQARLLRTLQEKAYRRVGGSTWRSSAFRLVCATHRDLTTEVAAGRFRADLYHRIASICCRTPSLVERREDIDALAAHFIAAGGAPAPTMSSALRTYLAQRDYPGNVRELAQLLRACLCRYAGGGVLSLASLPEDELQRMVLPLEARHADAQARLWGEAEIDDFVRKALIAEIGLKDLGRCVEAAAVRLALSDSESLTQAAARLGVTPRALHLRRAAERESPGD